MTEMIFFLTTQVLLYFWIGILLMKLLEEKPKDD
jgi:hypothetical protein